MEDQQQICTDRIVSELEDMMIKITQSEKQKIFKMKKS